MTSRIRSSALSRVSSRHSNLRAAMRNRYAIVPRVAPSPSGMRGVCVFVRSVMPYPCAGSMIAVMVVSISLFDGRVPRNLEWTDQARGAATPRSPSRNGYAGFFPLPRSGGIPREAKKPSAAVLRCAAGLTAAGRSLPGPRTAIEAAMVAARQQNGDHHGYHRHLHCVEQRLHRLG